MSSYEDLYNLVQESGSNLPLVISDGEGHTVTITEGWSDTQRYFEPVRVHYFKVVLDTGDPEHIQIDYFGEDNVHSTHILPREQNGGSSSDNQE